MDRPPPVGVVGRRRAGGAAAGGDPAGPVAAAVRGWAARGGRPWCRSRRHAGGAYLEGSPVLRWPTGGCATAAGPPNRSTAADEPGAWPWPPGAACWPPERSRARAPPTGVAARSLLFRRFWSARRGRAGAETPLPMVAARRQLHAAPWPSRPRRGPGPSSFSGRHPAAMAWRPLPPRGRPVTDDRRPLTPPAGCRGRLAGQRQAATPTWRPRCGRRRAAADHAAAPAPTPAPGPRHWERRAARSTLGTAAPCAPGCVLRKAGRRPRAAAAPTRRGREPQHLSAHADNRQAQGRGCRPSRGGSGTVGREGSAAPGRVGPDRRTLLSPPLGPPTRRSSGRSARPAAADRRRRAVPGRPWLGNDPWTPRRRLRPAAMASATWAPRPPLLAPPRTPSAPSRTGRPRRRRPARSPPSLTLRDVL